ncbi:hypothetical protein I6A84_05375 [Frankia sp. CNm7]|uniref:Uncharacterized protein n=1 Tax=Frankia nepalensis TaxID=1836974 RepID=A0A937RP49_9ACTN|nr:hypothetical protein [Frankia nepalensis]MBL7496277.1 hypothetical protein [Frankia nepalensis]MBL7513831.1 hypothetical protein [Frankia nepalensis]MBL7517570.1 hypothetical protein [Frankia nepalensis]MBL7633740.1 hypothetical protein [Frankia nepalensis]
MTTLMDRYATATGTNLRQLEIRLMWLVREYTRHTTPKAGQPARLDIRSDQARWVAEGLLDACRVFDRRDLAGRSTVVAAVRRAEDRWWTVRGELLREDIARADLRPEEPMLRLARPAGGRSLPAQQATHARLAARTTATGRPRGRELTRQR